MSTTALVLFTCFGFAAETAAPTEYRAGIESIATRELRSWLEFLASAELEGRDSGSRGYDTASRFIASMLAAMGVEPGAADGSFWQRFTLVTQERDSKAAALSMRVEGADPTTISLEGKVAVAASGAIDWKARWVFAGFGAGAAEDARDEFHGLAVAESVVLVVPRNANVEDGTLGARAAGARRIVVVSDRHARRGAGMRRRVALAHILEAETARAAGVEVVWISEEVADAILRSRSLSVSALRSSPETSRSFVFDDAEITLSVPIERSESATQNVVGRIPGSDPVLRDDAVVIGAHLDHVGRERDKIFFGADDDASGCVATLAAAKAFCANGRRPKRSVIVVFFGAEEKGLHGSRYYVDHPTVPLDRVAAMFNLDMVGRDEEREPRKDGEGKIVEEGESAADNVNSLHVVGSKRTSLEFDPWIQRINAAVGFDLEYDEDRVWRRSDQYNFAAHGVPVAFFFAGFHRDYHQPTDTVEKINWDKLERVTKLVYALAFEVADRTERLRRNRL